MAKKKKSKKITKNQVVASHVLKQDKVNRQASEVVNTKIKTASKAKAVVVTGTSKKASMSKKGFTLPMPVSSANVAEGTTPFFSLDLGVDAFELPRNIRDLHAFYRHFSQNDEIISRALELRTVLPLSKIIVKFKKLQYIDYSKSLENVKLSLKITCCHYWRKRE